MTKIGRRDFMKQTTAMAAGTALGAAAFRGAAEEPDRFDPLPTAVILNMLPDDLPMPERFAFAAECGFDGIEALPVRDLDEAARQREYAEDVGLRIHSVLYGWWRHPPLEPDAPEVLAGIREMENALRCASAMGADAVLLVSGVVTPAMPYARAYEQSQRDVQRLIPLAEELGVIIAIENVWNDFLLSPLEFAQYIDEFESPWVQAYFDVANIVAFGYPQDWIRTLGSRIRRIHFKDFHRHTREWTPLLEGTVDFLEVRKALDEVGYTDFVTAELPGGDMDYFREVVERMKRINAGDV